MLASLVAASFVTNKAAFGVHFKNTKQKTPYNIKARYVRWKETGIFAY